MSARFLALLWFAIAAFVVGSLVACGSSGATAPTPTPTPSPSGDCSGVA